MDDDLDNLDICPLEGHRWRTMPSGGDPTEPGSRELVTYCTRCGCDQSEVSEESCEGDAKP